MYSINEWEKYKIFIRDSFGGFLCDFLNLIPKSNHFLFKNCSELLYHMDLKKVLVVNDELLHVLVVDVHHGFQHDPEVNAGTCNRFLFKNYSELIYHMAL